MRKNVAAALMSVGLAVTAVAMPIAAEEVTTVEAETVVETETMEEETVEETEPFDYSAGYEENGFFKGIHALDYVTLPAYVEVEVDAADVAVGEDEIQSQVDQMLAAYQTTEEVTEGEVQDGDTVNIDYVGSIDGVEFEGGNTQGNGTNVTIGVTSYIDDFLEQLIGHTPGETINVEVTFPEDYGKEELNGKDAVFVTTINHIVKTNTPELDDAFAAENLDVETAEEYLASVEKALYDGKMMDTLLMYLLDNAEVSEVPESAVDTIYAYQYEYIRSMCVYYGMEVTDFLTYQGMTEDDLREQCKSYAEQVLILQAVMEDAGLTVSEEEAMEIVGADEEQFASFIDFYGKGYVYNYTLPNCVSAFMQESVIVVEAEEETEVETEAESDVETEEAETEVETTEAE